MQGDSVEAAMNAANTTSTAIVCPRCKSEECVIPAEAVFESLPSMYGACRSCMPEISVSKQMPFDQLAQFNPIFRDIDDATMRCPGCKKRSLDIAIAHVLSILIREGLRAGGATLFDVGTPMIAIGYPVPFPPRLGRNMLILIMDAIDKNTAEMITNEVSEVKGVIQRKGKADQPVGILNTGGDCASAPHTYDLLSGCDVRADVVSSAFGELCIYKTQSDTHIEFSRLGSDKIAVLESLYYQRKLKGRVADVCCGAGTLGLVSVLAGAREVILNDAFLPAVKNTLINIRANASTLGLDPAEIKIHTDPAELETIADTSMLVATASGSCDLSVYHSDLVDLAATIDRCDLCLIDAFMGVPTDGFVRAWKEAATMVVTI